MKQITIDINQLYAPKMGLFCETANDLIKGINVTYSLQKGLIIQYTGLEALFACAKFYGQFTVLHNMKQGEELKDVINFIRTSSKN